MTGAALISVANSLVPIVMSSRGGSIGIYGYVHSGSKRVVSAALTLVQRQTHVDADHVVVEHGLLDPQRSGHLEPGFAIGLDAGFYISAGFPAAPGLKNGLASVEAVLGWDDGSHTALRLCFATLDIVETTSLTGSPQLVGIAMATFNPDPVLFSRQIQSLRDQTHPDWICVISDDGSEPARLRHIEATIAMDRRFVLRPSRLRLGFYRNFERALASLPVACAFIAFSDQDDVWKPTRLAAHIALLDGNKADCLYSDMSVVQSDGTLLSPSFWVHRQPHYGSLSGLLLANVATGMSMLFRRTLVPLALPFPATPNAPYHDHWIALLSERRGTLYYSPSPEVAYIQHGANHTGALTPPVSAISASLVCAKRILDIVLIPVSRVKDPELNKTNIADAAYWSHLEPARFRILASWLKARLASQSPSRAERDMASVCEDFGLLSLLRARIDWRDRYRRSVAAQLVIGFVFKKIIVAYVSWQKRRAARSLDIAHVES